MGAHGSKDSEGLAWGVTMQRRKKKAKRYSKDQLKALKSYLNTKISKIREHVTSLHGSEDGWQQEYYGITEGLDATFEASKEPENAEKNRYLNISAYDHSRVTITPNENNGNSDYINANFIRGYNREKAYIAGQGPVPEAMHDFWQMVWEYDIKVVAMVTNEVEGGKLKCHRYWPNEGQTLTYGGFSVTTDSQQARSTSIIRRMTLQNNELQQKYKLTQIQFIVWPDHGVPDTAAEILTFREEIHKEMAVDPNAPLLIHCSAGVGRTGTYIAIDRLINAAESMDDDLSVREVVADMRRDRNYMVQTLVQYGYVYLALLDAMQKGLQRVDQEIAAMERDEAAKAEAELAEINAQLQESQDKTRGYRKMAPTQQKYSTLYRETKGPVMAEIPEVSVASRMESIMKSTTSEQSEKEKVGGWTSLAERIEAFKMSIQEGTYEDASKHWDKTDSYDIKATLDPVESRAANEVAQEHAWEHLGESFREQVTMEAEQELATLQARVENLKDSIQSAHQVTKKTAPPQEEGFVSLADRVASLKAFEPSKASFGKVLDEPKPIQRVTKSQKKAPEPEIKEEVKEEPIAEEEEKKDEVPELPINAREPEPDNGPAIVEESISHSILKPTEEKKDEEHPMVKAARESASSLETMKNP